MTPVMISRMEIWKAFLSVALLVVAGMVALPVWADEEAPDIPRIDPALFRAFLADPETLTLIDARSAEEYAEQHIAGAVNIPFDKVDESFLKLPAYAAGTIVTYCRTGRRASLLKAELAEYGYSDVRVLSSEQIIHDDEGLAFNCGTAEKPARCQPPIN